MERYSKQYSSKWQSQYSEEFKRHVCNDFLTGTRCRREVERKYKIGHSRLDFWLKGMGYPDFRRSSIVPSHIMPKPIKSTKEENATIKQLKKELEDAKLLAEAYLRMIKLAEKELKISIRKKSSTK
jgi:transposase-like protein